MRVFLAASLLAGIALLAGQWLFTSNQSESLPLPSSERSQPAPDRPGKVDPTLAAIDSAPGEVALPHRGATNEESQQGEATSASLEPARRPISYDHPQLVENILSRQSSLEFATAVLRGEIDPPSSLGESAHSAAQLAVMIDLDANARSELLDAPKRFEPADPAVHQLVSGGAYYRFAVGEYPAYDKIRDLLNEFGKDVPHEQIPLDAILEISSFAQSYSVN